MLKEYENLDDLVQVCNLNTQVLQAMDDWVRVINKDGKVIFANKAMRRDCKITELGMTSFTDHTYDDTSLVPQSTSLITLMTGRNFEKEITFKDKRYSVKSSPVYEGDTIMGSVEVFRDISSEVKVRQALIDANRKLHKDINLARNIQKKILPKKGGYGKLSLKYFYEPSEDLSGDLYDLIKIDENNYGVYICDVVGHGLAASLLTMFIKQNVTSILSQYSYTSPSSLLYELRNRFIDLGLSYDQYFTIFYGVYNQESKIFTYSNAGHNCSPILKRNRQFEILNTSGVPISEVFMDKVYKEKEIQLEIDDKLIFYTDGFTEATNSDGEGFGLDRFIQAVMESDDVINQIVERVINFNWGSSDDDMALMVLKILQ